MRRHIVSRANQAKNRLLLKRMEEWEHDLVFVSAHFGARPEHAVWQGKVYSVSGTSDKYPPLVESTGYGTVTGLCGVNCRHDMTPYVEGLSQLPDTDWSAEERRYGMTSDEYYEAVQKQRVYERRVRDSKRKVAWMERMGMDPTEERISLGKRQKRLREYTRELGLRRNYERERAYAIGMRQPRGLAEAVERGRRIKDRALPGGRSLMYVTDRKTVESREYRRKFKALGYDRETTGAIYRAAKGTCTAATGTAREALALVSTSRGKIVAISINDGDTLEVAYTRRIRKAIASHPKGDLIAVHNHPNNVPPTGSDFASAFSHGYKAGIVSCHNGDVWYFEPGDAKINAMEFDNRFKKCLKDGLTQEQAMEKCVEHYSHMSGGLKCVKL